MKVTVSFDPEVPQEIAALETLWAQLGVPPPQPSSAGVEPNTTNGVMYGLTPRQRTLARQLWNSTSRSLQTMVYLAERPGKHIPLQAIATHFHWEPTSMRGIVGGGGKRNQGPVWVKAGDGYYVEPSEATDLLAVAKFLRAFA